ncbi:hypothetical protein B0T14DRAFT_511249 [Immersiella caudata]|uniref:MYND-type domain-containing protein n=1 Tax=Immersiella caudata TaxID=314043 RepID=A0AA39X405_9PEZI|nr:hypothetical protein B0T14DRAFT_511249 [Immersiella caudata]
MSTPNFSDLSLFPTFATCPEDPSAHPTKPYYLLGQIKDDMTITKPTLVLSDRESSPFALVFDGLDRDGLDFKRAGLKKGHTAVIPDGRQVPPKEEGKRGFVSVEGARAGEVKGIPGPLEKVLRVALELRVREGEEGRCDVCAAAAEDVKLKKCTGCKGASYCSKECQAAGWSKEGHKEACGIIRAIKEIWPKK